MSEHCDRKCIQNDLDVRCVRWNRNNFYSSIRAHCDACLNHFVCTSGRNAMQANYTTLARAYIVNRPSLITLPHLTHYPPTPHSSPSHTSLITLPHFTHYPPTPHSLPSHTHPPLSHCILFIGMLYIRLRGRASRTLVGLGRLLRQMGKGAGTVSRVQLQQALRAFHISLTPEVRTITHTTLPGILLSVSTGLQSVVEVAVR